MHTPTRTHAHVHMHGHGCVRVHTIHTHAHTCAHDHNVHTDGHAYTHACARTCTCDTLTLTPPHPAGAGLPCPRAWHSHSLMTRAPGASADSGPGQTTPPILCCHLVATSQMAACRRRGLSLVPRSGKLSATLEPCPPRSAWFCQMLWVIRGAWNRVRVPTLPTTSNPFLSPLTSRPSQCFPLLGAPATPLSL